MTELLLLRSRFDEHEAAMALDKEDAQIRDMHSGTVC
jgi:hypothetical protein